MPSRFDEAYSVDTKKAGFVVDMSPSTILEELQDGGFQRTTKPVGQTAATGDQSRGTGGKGLIDTEAAMRLGANGNKK
jgi:hypothetical protein